MQWFAHEFSSNIAATRAFYHGLVGLPLVWDEPDSVAFVHGSAQIAFTEASDFEPAEGWALQPGWGAEQIAVADELVKVRSWSIALAPQQFRNAVDRLIAANVPRLWPVPRWVGYWSFVTRDPNGTTVELSDPVTDEDTVE